MRLIHTADWQIGKVFRFAGDGTMPLLQAARLDAIGTIGRLAAEQGVPAVLVAGDIYDKEGLADRTLLRPLERMQTCGGIAWHLIPGNHDPHRANGVWQRVRALGLPANVHLHLDPAPVPLDERTCLLPAPLRLHQASGDPTAWMDEAATADGVRRIGLAHGSIRDFGSESATPNLIDPARARRAGLAYLALGDWHGTRQIDRLTWYAGTPEPDRFDRPESGQVLLVDTGAAAAPTVTPLRVGRYRWLAERATLHDADDVIRLARRLRDEHADLSTVLLDLLVDGLLSLAARARFEQEIEIALGAALCHLRLDADGLQVDPSADDLDELAGDRVIRTALQRLQTIAGTAGHPERDVAGRALQHLYLACHRRRREAAA